jgi:hypothetical protein
MIITQTTNSIKEPRITLVGAGPGDAELISIKGVRVLKSADVVLYDALVNCELLQFAPENAIKVFVGKRSGDHSYSQQAVNKLMIDYLFLDVDLRNWKWLHHTVSLLKWFLVYRAVFLCLPCRVFH